MALHGISIKPSHEGRFARDVGKKPGTPISGADIAKGLASKDPAERKRANFARNARKWKHGGKKARGDGEHARRMYGQGSKAKVEDSSEAKHPARQHIKRIGSK